MPEPLALFRLEFFRVTPAAHDALCRAEERSLRDSGLFDHLDFEARHKAVQRRVREKLPWAKQCCGQIQTEFRDGKFYGDFYVAGPDGQVAYQESFDLGSVHDEPEDLRAAMRMLPVLAAERLPATAFIDAEQFLVMVERFDFKRFCGDHRLPQPTVTSERARKWN